MRPRIEAASHTPNWVKARIGHLTGSRMYDACLFNQNGQPSAKRSNYQRDLVAERMTDSAMNHYVNDAMRWGIEHEAQALSAFEKATGLLVWPAGFVRHPDIEFFGATPDGFVSIWTGENLERELVIPVEAKCPTTPVFIKWRIANEIPDEHRYQLLSEMSCCRSLIGIFIAYDPRIRIGRNLIWHILELPDRSELEEVEAKARTFLEQVEVMFRKVTEKDGNAPVPGLSADHSGRSVHEGMEAADGERADRAPD